MSVIIRIWGIVALMRSECWDLTGYFMVKDWQDDKLQKSEHMCKWAWQKVAFGLI